VPSPVAPPRALTLATPGEVVRLGLAADARARVRLAAAGGSRAALEARPGGAPERLRVCLLVPRVDVGGGARILFEHANRLHDRGHDVLVLAHFPPPDWFPLRAPYRHVPVGIDITAALPPCDVVVCGYWDQVAAARAAAVAPVVHFEQGDFHLFEALDPGVEAVVRANMDAADATTTVSGQVGTVLTARYGVAEPGVVHNAIDPAVFSAHGPRRAGAPYVLCVGWDGNEFKGMAEVRELHRRLVATRPDLELVWVTPRPPREPMGEVVVSPSQPELAALYRGAAVYLCASRYESFPLPPLEAMACGAPVVTTDNVGVLEYARDGDNALVVGIGDVDAMAAAVGRVLDEPELAAGMVAGGLRTAGSFAWERIVTGLEARYRALAGRRIARRDADEWEVVLPGAEPEDAAAAARLALALETATAREILVPVTRPAIDGHAVVSWEPAARRDGGEGTARVHAPHAHADRGSLPHQAGLDALAAEQPAEALAVFIAAHRASESPARRGALGKWVALTLVELYREGEALDILEPGLREFPDNPDYAYLAALVAPLAGREVDLAHALANVQLVGAGWRYDDWLADPAGLLAARL
jgi:glycosyltransferase involved in cell wall biosynthesis